ncbi:hypothetical protein HMI55_007011 [Coelomomyces lativittatus]|nr:hypothetical protein HMI55_007011 [Coelomomyces lativittatus]
MMSFPLFFFLYRFDFVCPLSLRFMTSSFQIFHLESTYVQKDTNTTTSSSSTTTATTTTTTHSLSLQPTSELRESTTSTSPSFTSTSPLFKPDSTPSSLTHSTSPTLIKQNELPSTVPFTIQPRYIHPLSFIENNKEKWKECVPFLDLKYSN